MSKIELEKGKSYLLEQDGYSRYPSISIVKCLDVTNVCYLLKWNNGNEIWGYKKNIVDSACFPPQYRVIEQL